MNEVSFPHNFRFLHSTKLVAKRSVFALSEVGNSFNLHITYAEYVQSEGRINNEVYYRPDKAPMY